MTFFAYVFTSGISALNFAMFAAYDSTLCLGVGIYCAFLAAMTWKQT